MKILPLFLIGLEIINMAVNKVKTISLETKDMKTLVELLHRGLAYTDMYYRDYKKMDGIWDKVLAQLKEQGATGIFNGEISFNNKNVIYGHGL